MRKVVSFFISFCFFVPAWKVMPFFSNHADYSLIKIEDRISDLNKTLLKELSLIEGALGNLPESVRPEHFLFNGFRSVIEPDFYVQAPRINRLIDFCIKVLSDLSSEKDGTFKKLVSRFLDNIMRISYYQTYKECNDFHKYQIFEDAEISEVTQFLYHMYEKQSLDRENFSYDYLAHNISGLDTDFSPKREVLIPLVMTKALNEIFAVKTTRWWGLKEKICFLEQKCFVVKAELKSFLAGCDHCSGKDIDLFFETLQRGVIQGSVPATVFNWLKEHVTGDVVKFTIKSGLVVLCAVAALKVGKYIYSGFKEIGSSAVKKVDERLGKIGEEWNTEIKTRVTEILDATKESVGEIKPTLESLGGKFKEPTSLVDINVFGGKKRSQDGIKERCQRDLYWN